MKFDVIINKSELKGKLSAFPSKSMLHRTIIAAGLSKGKSVIKPFAYSDDISATLNGIKALGATYKVEGNVLYVYGVENYRYTKDVIHVFDSASTLRFFIPIMSLLNQPVTFSMDKSLQKRPLTTYEMIFKDGLVKKNEFVTISKPIQSGDFYLEDALSSQYITGLLFTLPLLKESSKIYIENLGSKAYIDLTIDVLDAFGIHIEETDYGYLIPGNQRYKAKNIKVDGDYSQSAFFLCAGLFHPYVEVDGLNLNSKQADYKIVQYIKQMNGKIIFNEEGFTTFKSSLKGIDININQSPDLAPILAFTLSLSQGKSSLYNGSRLRLKESDRIASTVSVLNALGAEIEVDGDTMIIHPIEAYKGGITLDAHKDHRIVMMLAVAGSILDKPITIKNAHYINKSYPTFFEDYSKLGGCVEIIKRGEDHD
jgi:3-phosphoshikimate 1-carboxyvinyltransferase